MFIEEGGYNVVPRGSLQVVQNTTSDQNGFCIRAVINIIAELSHQLYSTVYPLFMIIPSIDSLLKSRVTQDPRHYQKKTRVADRQWAIVLFDKLPNGKMCCSWKRGYHCTGATYN